MNKYSFRWYRPVGIGINKTKYSHKLTVMSFYKDTKVHFKFRRTNIAPNCYFTTLDKDRKAYLPKIVLCKRHNRG
jgi:hypothetical protein